jgi:thioredoxin reductase (NADPH)
MAEDSVAFPTLDGTHISFLETIGGRQHMKVGDYLYRAGDDTYDFFSSSSRGTWTSCSRVTEQST